MRLLTALLAIAGCTMCTAEGIMAIGGETGSPNRVAINTTEIWDASAAGSATPWVPGPAMKRPRYSFAAAVLNGQSIFVSGGDRILVHGVR